MLQTDPTSFVLFFMRSNGIIKLAQIWPLQVYIHNIKTHQENCKISKGFSAAVNRISILPLRTSRQIWSVFLPVDAIVRSLWFKTSLVNVATNIHDNCYFCGGDHDVVHLYGICVSQMNTDIFRLSSFPLPVYMPTQENKRSCICV